MKKVVLILLAILMVTTLALGFTACKSECDKGNHVWDQGTVDKEATCAELGKITYKCTLCDHGQKVESIPKTNNHTPIDASVAPNCTDAGITGATKCSVCGITINAGTVIAALGHDYKYVATPGDDKTHEEYCDREGCVYSKTVPHTPNEDGSACKDCGKALSSGLPVHEHDKYLVSTTPATCTTKAIEHWACHDDCGWAGEDIEVGEALGHNYQGQPWKTYGTTHYQECKNGCNVRNEHAADMGAYALTDGQHVSACAEEGCSITIKHAPSFGAYITTDETNHYKLCSKCNLTTDEGKHDHDKLTNLNGEQHGVACSVCNKKFDNAAHVWVLNEQASEAATCTKEGKAVYNCACGRTNTVTLEMIDHTYTYVDNDEARVYTCSVCKHVETVPHAFVWDNSIKDEHYKKCQTCGYILESTRGAHDYSNGFTCATCNRAIEGIVALTYYNNQYTRHDTLVAAVNSITDNSAAIIYLGQDLEGAGIFIPEGRNITLLLQGNTYTVASGAVGSTGTETQGFHIEKDSNVTIQNGTITSKAGSGVKMLVQNYANLTLDVVTLDGTNLDSAGSAKNYTLSNNYGSVTMTSTTINAKAENGVAFDLWYGSHESYLGGVNVTVGANCNINGAIEYGSAIADADWSKVALRLRSNKTYTIVFTSTNVTCDTANIKKVDVNNASVETKLAHLKDSDWTWNNGKHYHECGRCSAHLDEATCVQVEKDAKEPTCTDTGLTATVWCATCEHVYIEQTTIKVLGHDYQGVQTTAPTCEEKGLTTYTCSRCGDSYTEDIDALGHDWDEGEETTSPTCTVAGVKTFTCSRCEDTRTETIPATGHTKGEEYDTTAQGHAHKCTVCGEAAEDYTDHIYDNNVCECGHEITVAKIYDMYTNYTSSEVNTNGTFKLEGKVKAIGNYSTQYTDVEDLTIIVTDGDNKYEFYCWQVKDGNGIKGIDIKVDDIVTIVNCGIKKHNGKTLELVNAAFDTHNKATYVIDTTADHDQVTINDLPESAKRGEEIKFTVTAKEGYRIVSVTLNGQTLTLQDGKYTFTVTAENVIVIKSSSANALPDHNASSERKDVTIVNSEELNIGASGNQYSGENVKGTKIVDGITYDWDKVANNKNTNFQMNGSSSTGKDGYLKITVPGNIISLVINLDSDKYSRLEVNGVKSLSSTIALNASSPISTITITSNDSIRITSIVMSYNVITACDNKQEPTHVEAVGATCTTDGNKEYWQCKDCSKYFIKDDAGNYVEVTQADTVINATHTPATAWEHGAVEDTLSHWHICSVCGEKVNVTPCNQNDTIAGKAATCTETGLKEGKKCDVCGQVTLEQQETQALGHDYFYLGDQDALTHSWECQREGCDASEDDVACKAKDNELHKGTDTHWYLCVCGNKVGETGHSYNASNECVCGAVKGAVEADIAWSVYANSKDKDNLLSEEAGMALIKGLAATQFVSDTVTFTIDDNYRVVSVTNTDMSDENPTAQALTSENGQYSFVASADGNFIDIVVIRQYTVALAEDTDSAITATLDGKELPNKFDEETSSILVISLGSKAETHRLATVTYTADGGTPVSILNDNGTLNTVPVNAANVTITITIEEIPAEPELVYTLTTSVSGTNNSYASSCDVEVDGITWNVEGNSQMNPWRFGGKSLSDTDRKLTSKTAISDNVSKVIISFGSDSNNANLKVNSVTFKVYKSDPTSGSSTAIYTNDKLIYAANSSVTVEKPDNTDWSNCYYQITFNLTNSKTSNYFVSVSSIEFYA